MPAASLPPLDRTAKLYIGGKQARPDADASLAVTDAAGRVLGEVGRGSRKDVRNAVEAARKAQAGWAKRTAHNRAQILFYLAENLEARHEEFVARLAAFSGDAEDAAAEVDAAVSRLFAYAGWADKWDGRVHATPFRNVTLAMREPIGVMGAVCPDARPLLGFISAVAPLVAMGNAVVAIPSETAPLPATDLYQVLDTSDVPGGVINIVTGLRAEVVPTLAAHDDVDGIWHFGSARGRAAGREGVHRQHEADLGRLRPRSGLVVHRTGSGCRVPARGHAGQEHLGALRRVSPAASVCLSAP